MRVLTFLSRPQVFVGGEEVRTCESSISSARPKVRTEATSGSSVVLSRPQVFVGGEEVRTCESSISSARPKVRTEASSSSSVFLAGAPAVPTVRRVALR